MTVPFHTLSDAEFDTRLTVSGKPSSAFTPALPRIVSSVIDSRTLLGQSGELRITHNNRIYRLRVTLSGKLILTA